MLRPALLLAGRRKEGERHCSNMDPGSIVQYLVGVDQETATSVITQVLTQRPELAPGIVNAAVPDLTYAPAKAMTERRSRGVIKRFNPTSGYGFIECPELKTVFGADVYLHAKQIGQCCDGMDVTFAVMLGPDLKPKAFDVQPASGAWNGGMGKGMGGWQDPYAGWGGKGFDKGWGKDAWGKDSWGKDSWGKGGGMPPGMKGGGKPVQTDFGPPPADQVVLGSFSGTIKSFNPTTQFGFIECPGLQAQGFAQNDVFLHGTQAGQYQVGNQVTFTVNLNRQGKPQARDLRDATGEPDMMDPAAKRMRTE